MIIDCVSDLHGHYPKLEGGDYLDCKEVECFIHKKKKRPYYE